METQDEIGATSVEVDLMYGTVTKRASQCTNPSEHRYRSSCGGVLRACRVLFPVEIQMECTDNIQIYS